MADVEFRDVVATPELDQLYWAPGTGLQPVVMDPQVTQNNSVNFVARWVSPPLWNTARAPDSRIATLEAVVLEYVSEAASTMEVDGSADGGENWITPMEAVQIPVPTVLHHQGVEVVSVEYAGLKGHDLRFRICFTEPEIIIVKGFVARIIVAGDVRFKNLRFAT